MNIKKGNNLKYTYDLSCELCGEPFKGAKANKQCPKCKKEMYSTPFAKGRKHHVRDSRPSGSLFV